MAGLMRERAEEGGELEFNSDRERGTCFCNTYVNDNKIGSGRLSVSLSYAR